MSTRQYGFFGTQAIFFFLSHKQCFTRVLPRTMHHKYLCVCAQAHTREGERAHKKFWSAQKILSEKLTIMLEVFVLPHTKPSL